jgi:uncharacterized repeat protein (TIGR03803 family)
LTLVILIAGTGAWAQTVTTIYDFGSNRGDGANPQAGVTFDKDGNMFGTAALGGNSDSNGVIFRMSPPAGGDDPWPLTALHRFTGQPNGGESPVGRLIVTPSGKIFGTTLEGGIRGMGTAFALMPEGKLRVLYSFGSFVGDGVLPNAGLLASDHVLYGVTGSGGANGRGTIFQLTPPTGGGDWTETILYNFAPLPDAAFPSSELVMDQNGNLYGTALQGGANNLGAVYQLSPPAGPGASWTETVIYSFNGDDGTLPSGRLEFDANGTIYGTTDGGGARQEGTVFSLTPPAKAGDPWTEAVLYSFSGGRDGGNPTAGVIFDNQGRLFGPASTGGSGGPDFGGVLFRLDPPAGGSGAWTETVLYSFGGPNGFRSLSQLVRKNGAMYGTTSAGGRFGIGTVFVMTP